MSAVDDLLAAARARLQRLSPADAHACAARGGLIVDIRSDLQRQEDGLVPGALVVPRNVLEWRADPGSAHRDPSIVAVPGPLVLMCAEGYQSSLAAATLQDMGVERATDMIGGFQAWAEAGLPGCSGHEEAPTTSLALIRRLRASGPGSNVDIGGGAARLLGGLRTEHVTPGGTIQPLVWTVLRRLPPAAQAEG